MQVPVRSCWRHIEKAIQGRTRKVLRHLFLPTVIVEVILDYSQIYHPTRVRFLTLPETRSYHDVALTVDDKDHILIDMDINEFDSNYTDALEWHRKLVFGEDPRTPCNFKQIKEPKDWQFLRTQYNVRGVNGEWLEICHGEMAFQTTQLPFRLTILSLDGHVKQRIACPKKVKAWWTLSPNQKYIMWYYGFDPASVMIQCRAHHNKVWHLKLRKEECYEPRTFTNDMFHPEQLYFIVESNTEGCSLFFLVHVSSRSRTLIQSPTGAEISGVGRLIVLDQHAFALVIVANGQQQVVWTLLDASKSGTEWELTCMTGMPIADFLWIDNVFYVI
jgi:hypothetical protein